MGAAHSWALVLLGVCVLSAMAAAVVGIDDNLPGVLLASLAAAAFVLTFVHPWRAPGQFRRLLYASALGSVLFGLLHIALEALASNPGGSGVVQGLLNGAAAVCFLIAVLVCPPAFLVRAVGAVVTSIKGRRRPTPGPAAALRHSVHPAGGIPAARKELTLP